jgi:hypothetical protein
MQVKVSDTTMQVEDRMFVSLFLLAVISFSL